MNKLTVAQKRLVEDQYKTFVRQGAKLSSSDKQKTISNELGARWSVHAIQPKRT